MDKKEIAEFFKLQAELKHMSMVDPKFVANQKRLAELAPQYVALLKEANNEEKISKTEKSEVNEVPWQEALNYVAQIFMGIDLQEKDPTQVELRKAFFEIILTGVSGFYSKKEEER